jgi:hypothetical protein
MKLPENLKVDPKLLEAEMLKKVEDATNKMAEPVSIEEAASVLFGLFLPKFAATVNKLSSKSLKRLIYSLVAVPLEEARLNLKLPEEKEAYQIAEQLLVSKSALIMNAYVNEETVKQEFLKNNKKVEEFSSPDTKNEGDNKNG